MKKKSLSRVILGLFAMIILRGEECRPELTKDPGFDQWCGNKLCGWEVEKGSIGKVATWHRRDHGVALLGEEVVLGQLLEAGDDPPDCLVFELLVRYFPQQDGDQPVSLQLELDFLDDGVPETQQPIGAPYGRRSSEWLPVAYRLPAPAWYPVVHLRIRKVGRPPVHLAQVKVLGSNECADLAVPLPLANLPLGARCAGDGECASGICTVLAYFPASEPGEEQICSACRGDEGCPQGQLCGVLPGEHGWPIRSCVEAGSDRLGERCISGSECASGVCCVEICSLCCSEEDCGGVRCATQELGEGVLLPTTLPAQCDPGGARGAPGDPCLRDEDCAGEGSCEGAAGRELRFCTATGERCTEDEDCATTWLSQCVNYGVEDGHCR